MLCPHFTTGSLVAIKRRAHPKLTDSHLTKESSSIAGKVDCRKQTKLIIRYHHYTIVVDNHPLSQFHARCLAPRADTTVNIVPPYISLRVTRFIVPIFTESHCVSDLSRRSFRQLLARVKCSTSSRRSAVFNPLPTCFLHSIEVICFCSSVNRFLSHVLRSGNIN